MKNKFAILTVAGLLLLSLSASVIGFVRSNRTINNPNPTPTKQKVYVKYEYYLEDKQLDQMPEKEFLLDDEGLLFYKHRLSRHPLYLCYYNVYFLWLFLQKSMYLEVPL